MSDDSQIWNPMSISTDNKGNLLAIDYFTNLYVLIGNTDWIYLATNIMAI